VIALRKILKAVDVWLMSARWWTDLQGKMPYNNRINSVHTSFRNCHVPPSEDRMPNPLNPYLCEIILPFPDTKSWHPIRINLT